MRETLRQISETASLESAGAAPFRLKAVFSTFDYLGKPAGEGTLEETWLKPGTARRVITFRDQREEQVLHDGSARTSNDRFLGTFMERRILAALLTPVQSGGEVPEDKRLTYRPLKVDGGTLDCVVLLSVTPAKATPIAEESPQTAYCADGASHMLRVAQERYNFAVTYNKLVRLGGHVIAKQIVGSQQGVIRAKLDVTSFEAARDLTEKDFALPADAVDLAREDIALPGEVMASSLLKKVKPKFPERAKLNYVSGTVFLSAIIGMDGLVKELDVLSSPSRDLTESALEAVRQWQFRPYLVGGQAREVDTTIRVNYSFDR